jgi:O-methyltransferase
MIYDKLGVEVAEDEKEYAGKYIVTLGRGTGKCNTMNLAKRCFDQNIPGDLVECGVNAGGHPALMSFVIKKYKQDRRVHLYDSFRGVPQPGPKDCREWQEHSGTNPNPEKPVYTGSIENPREQVENNLRAWGADMAICVFHEGWFEEVLPKEKNTPSKIALLRIDVDLYHSTIPVMQYLYPRVQPGGYIIDDDWGDGEKPTPARTALLECLDKMGEPHPVIQRIPETRGTVWWQKK